MCECVYFHNYRYDVVGSCYTWSQLSHCTRNRKWEKKMKTYVHYAVYIETTPNIGIISISIRCEVPHDDVLLLKRWAYETAPLNPFDRQSNTSLRVFIGLHSRTNSIYATCDCASASALICTHNGWARMLFVFYLCDGCKSILILIPISFVYCTQTITICIHQTLGCFDLLHVFFWLVYWSFHKGDSMESA